MNVDITKTTQTVLSYCTGIRGIERGLERAGVDLRVAAFLEIEAFICENLVQAMEQGLLDSAPIWSNLKTFEPEPFRGLVDGMLMGYPCQPFSNAGNRKGNEDPRHLWPYIKQHIGVIRPFWIFGENVEGHLSMGFNKVLHGLREMDYTVEAGLFSAAETGASQERTRLFIFAVDNTMRNRSKQEYEVSTRRNSAELTSEELAHTDCVGHVLGHVLGQPEVVAAEGGQHALSKSITSDKHELGDSQGIGVEGHRPEGQQESQAHVKETISMCRSGGDRWPARPGEQQYDWEAPRSVKSGLGITVKRYNYREDFLRALGNSVIEQTAELAFKTLFNKLFHG